MCGIAGFVGGSSRETLERMIENLRHRGPDDVGVFTHDNVGLAHARLAIIDISADGHQPMLLPDESVAIVFNGEIYNYQELRDELARDGCSFRSKSDTEVLLWLYKKYGLDFLNRCVGMFAIAIYDFKHERLVLARDRMGEKPLYYTLQSGSFLFASELGALLKSKAIKPEVDTRSLAQYLALDYVPTPATIIKDVYKLEPATILVYERGEISKKIFWEPSRVEHGVEEGEAVRELDRFISQSVAGQLVSDVPLGVFLSGGIDSSTIAYYAARASSGTIDTFSIGFDEPSFDESEYARAVAAHLGTNHHEEVFTARQALDLIPGIPDVLSEPVADASILPTMLLSRFARHSVTVALGGDGGDELFAGYPTFQADVPFALFRTLPHQLRVAARAGVGMISPSHKNFPFSYKLGKLISTDERHAGRRHAQWLGTFGPTEIMRLMPGTAEDLYKHVDTYTKAGDGNDLLWMYARTYLMDQVLVKVDRGSMRYALETRAPFLDHRVVEYAFGLPYALKYRRGTTKYLLKKLMRGKLPDHIIDRKKKGFGIPLTRWLAHELRPLVDELLSHDALSHGFFDESYIKQIRDEHQEGHTDRRKELWNLIVFQLWYKTYLRS